MSEYTDSAFGFSFWYPSGWTAQNIAVPNPGIYPNNYKDGTVSKIIRVSTGDASDLNGVDIAEYTSPNMTITDDCPDCVSELDGYAIRYYFDTNFQTWMEQTGDAGLANATTPKPAVTNTMGGLHMLPGAQRFNNDSIVPLSATDFLIISSLDIGDPNRSGLIKTIVATDLRVATPVSVAQQETTIRAEAAAYANTN
jgi:hypothetical protein